LGELVSQYLNSNKVEYDIEKIQTVLTALKSDYVDFFTPLWNFFQHSYEGGFNYINAGYLIQHKFEKYLEYEKRRKNSYYNNQCKRIINNFVKHVYRKYPERYYGDVDYNDFIDFYIGGNREVNRNLFFWQELTLKLVLGEIYIIIDHPPIPDNIQISDQERIDKNIKYTVELIKPQNMVIYRPELNIAVIDLGCNIYKLWTDTRWIVFKNNNIIDQGFHTFGCIPILCDKLEDGSLIKDVAQINKMLYNIENQIWWDVLSDSYSSIFLPMSAELLGSYGMMGSLNKDSGDTEIILKPINFMAPGSEPKTISHNPAMIQIKQVEVDKILEKIRVLTNQRMEEIVNQSGISKSYDFDNFNASLELIAGQQESIETEFDEMFLLISKGIKSPDNIKITYNYKFDIVDDSQENTQLAAIITTPGGSQYAKNLAFEQWYRNNLIMTDEDAQIVEDELFNAPIPVVVPIQDVGNPIIPMMENVVNTGNPVDTTGNEGL
jgi:hypothetical protein